MRRNGGDNREKMKMKKKDVEGKSTKKQEKRRNEGENIAKMKRIRKVIKIREFCTDEIK